MLASTWELWTRDATPVWSATLIGGCAAFVIHSLREPSGRGFVPVVVALVAVATAGLMCAPLPARAWVMLLPLGLVCAVAGVSRLGSMLALSAERRGAKAPFATMVIVAIVSLPLFTVVRRPFLCAEPNGLVEVEQAVEECKARGSDRCALVSRYTPATRYYMAQKGIPSLSLPTSPSTERVYIVADGNRPLKQLWHNGVEGFEAYAPPRLWRELTQSAVYVAERRPAQASAW
jgi:hypothetical protein